MATDKITDAITQSNLLVLGSAPAAAVAMLYQTVAQAMGNAANNATYGQQQGNTLMLSVVSTGCALVLAQKPK